MYTHMDSYTYNLPKYIFAYRDQGESRLYPLMLTTLSDKIHKSIWQSIGNVTSNNITAYQMWNDYLLITGEW